MVETSGAVGIGTRCRLDPPWARRAERGSREADAKWPSASPPSAMDVAGARADSLLGGALRIPTHCAAPRTAQPHAQCGLMHCAAKGTAQPMNPRSQGHCAANEPAQRGLKQDGDQGEPTRLPVPCRTPGKGRPATGRAGEVPGRGATREDRAVPCDRDASSPGTRAPSAPLESLEAGHIERAVPHPTPAAQRNL